MKIPLVEVTNYRDANNTWDIKLQLCVSALFLLTYSMLIDEVNKGKNYPKVIGILENKSNDEEIR
jgi:hypothetical protein